MPNIPNQGDSGLTPYDLYGGMMFGVLLSEVKKAYD